MLRLSLGSSLVAGAMLFGMPSAGLAQNAASGSSPTVLANAADWSCAYGGISAGAGAFSGRALDWNDDIFEDPEGDLNLDAFAAR